MTDIREIVLANVLLDNNGITVRNTNAALINTVFQKISIGTFSVTITGDILTQTTYPYIILTSVGTPNQLTITNNSPIITSNSYEFIIEIYDQSNNLVDGTVNLVIYEGGSINQ